MTQDQPVPPADGPSPAPSTPAAAAPAAPAPGIRWQDRVIRLPSVIAVALATLIMGGFAGIGVSAWVRHDDRPHLRHGVSDRMRHHAHPGDGWGRGEGPNDGSHTPPPTRNG